jgi:hypothetical protein
MGDVAYRTLQGLCLLDLHALQGFSTRKYELWVDARVVLHLVSLRYHYWIETGTLKNMNRQAHEGCFCMVVVQTNIHTNIDTHIYNTCKHTHTHVHIHFTMAGMLLQVLSELFREEYVRQKDCVA